MKTAWQMRQKFGWKMGAVQSTSNKPKRLQHSTFCDTFGDVVLTENCSAKIACYPCKVGEQHHNNMLKKFNQNIEVLFLFLFMWKCFNPSLTRLVESIS